ncbi:MAG: hypothetical protein ACOX5A_11860 [Aminivibrio sp.]|jgi:hypothetical protein
MRFSTAQQKICPLSGHGCTAKACMLWGSVYQNRDEGFCLLHKGLEKFVLSADEFDLDD